MTQPLSIFWNKVERVTKMFNPMGASIEITNRCNATCPYCYIPDRSTPADLTTEQLYYVIDKLNKAGVLFLNITGGDPFIRNDILPLLGAVFDANFFGVSIFTNGTLLTNEHIRFIADYHDRIDPFRMTVFSHSNRIHDEYTGVKGGLRKILDASEQLLARHVKVEVSIPVMDFNIDYVHETRAFLAEKSIDSNLSILKLICDCNTSPALQAMSSREFIYRYLALMDHDYYREDIDCFEKSQRGEQDSPALCRALRQTITVDTQGMLRPCVTFRKLVYGSIFDDRSLAEILRNCDLYRHISSLSKKDLPCSGCKFEHFCNPCLGNWHSDSGSFTIPSPGNCNFAAAFEAFYKKEPQGEQEK